MVLFSSFRSQLLIRAIITLRPLNSRVPVNGLSFHFQLPNFSSPLRYLLSRALWVRPSGSTYFSPRCRFDGTFLITRSGRKYSSSAK